MNELSRWMQVQGTVPFVKFMESALYHPEWGYYTGERRKIGKEGDFYTSPSIHPVFAEMLADEIAKKAQELGADDFVLIEFGAGEGRLARDVLNRWREAHLDLYQRASYRIVETSPALRVLQQEMTAEHAGRVNWLSEEELLAGAPYRGVVLTNELVDAFPVHRVTRTADGLQELYVRWDEAAERFVEQNGPLSDSRIPAYLERYGLPLLVGQVAEVGLPGLDWYERALRLLTEGWVITIDYGFEREMLYHSSRMKGTLRGFYRHTLTDDPYQHIGEQDLTADVNFTALQLAGEAAGWQTEFFGSQSRYLMDIGILTRLKETMGADPFRDPDVKRNRAIKQLILPGGIGDHFKVLVQKSSAS